MHLKVGIVLTERIAYPGYADVITNRSNQVPFSSTR